MKIIVNKKCLTSKSKKYRDNVLSTIKNFKHLKLSLASIK